MATNQRWRRSVLLLLLLSGTQLCFARYEDKEDFHNYRLYQLTPLTSESVKQLQRIEDDMPNQPDHRLGLTFFRFPNRVNSPVQVLVPPAALPQFKRRLASVSHVDQLMLHRNYGRLTQSVEQQNRWRPRTKRSVSGLQLRHTQYLRYSEMMNALRLLNSHCNFLLSGTCRLQEIGRTYENRQLTVIRIEKKNPGSQKQKVWIDGGIHAREWISPATVLMLIDTLISKGLTTSVDRSDELGNLLDSYDFLVLVLYNPDGYEFSHSHYRFWRKNREPVGQNSANRPCYGVDLNRNYGYMWGGSGSSGKPCKDNYRGSGPFSALETKAVSEFIAAENAASKFLLYLSYHSYGQYVLMPYGYKRNTYSTNDGHSANRLKCAAYALSMEMFEKNNRYYIHGTSADILYEASGGSDDWAHGSQRIPYSLTVELPDDGAYGFLLPPAYIQNVAKEVTFGLIALMRTITGLETNENFASQVCPRLYRNVE